MQLFTRHHVRRAAELLGSHGRLDNLRVLELGPLEGADTYQLAALGADVLAIEANKEAFLRCLIVKEIAGISNMRFLLGDINEFMRYNDSPFDLVYCAGILYHMPDPIETIELIALSSDKCFVSTHYYDPNHYSGPSRLPRQHPTFSELTLWVYELQLGDNEGPEFWGTNSDKTAWLSRDDIFHAFTARGLGNIQIIEEVVDHPNGAAVVFTATR